MRISDLVKVNQTFRAGRKARSFLVSLERRQEWLSQQGELTELHQAMAARERVFVNQLIARLDKNEFISTDVAWLGVPTRQHLNRIFLGTRPPLAAVLDEAEKALVALMDLQGKQSRAAGHKWRLSAEIATAHHLGWFMVFDTLTVSNHNLRKVFSKESTVFKDYIALVKRRVKSEHQYLAVVEEGGKTGRLHIHVLHMFEKLPKGTKDPNRSRRIPDYRELPEWKNFWSYGHNSPIAVRYGNHDAYGKIGWRWPFDRKSGSSLKTRSPQAIAGYMAKYVIKAYTTTKRRKYRWRVRKSQSLGNRLLNQIVGPLSNQTLLAIATSPMIRGKIRSRMIPAEPLRLQALRHLQKRLSSELLCVLAEGTTTRPSPLMSFRHLTRPTTTSNRPKTGTIETALMSDTEEFDALTELTLSTKEIERVYFPISTASGRALNYRTSI